MRVGAACRTAAPTSSRAAELEKGPVPEPVPGGPIENPNGVAVRDKGAQDLAGLVPVDEEHQSGSDRGQKGVALLGAFSPVSPGDEIEDSVVAESGHFLAVEAAPLRRKCVEQGDEELGTSQMDVRVGEGDGVALDRDHHHMGIRRPDVVLDDQPGTRARRGRAEPRVIELQAARFIDAAHEGLDDRAVAGRQAVDMGARHHFLCARARHPVEQLVQVHHQPMQAVAPHFRQPGQLGDLGRCDFIVGSGILRLQAFQATSHP